MKSKLKGHMDKHQCTALLTALSVTHIAAPVER